jgi:hypothetical protein
MDTKECRHGLRMGCYYCHGGKAAEAAAATARQLAKRPAKVSRLSEKMNDRMTTLNKRLKELRGQ